MRFPECGAGRCTWRSRNAVPRMRRGSVPVYECSFLRMFCPEVFCRFRSPIADMPLLKREVPAKQAVGFASAESGGGFLQPIRVGSADRQSARSSCGFADFGRFNLWRPIVVNRTCGSMCVQAQPVRVGSADRQSARNPADSKKPAASIYGGWFRVLSGGSKWNRALPGRLSNVSYSFFNRGLTARAI